MRLLRAHLLEMKKENLFFCQLIEKLVLLESVIEVTVVLVILIL